MEHEMPSSSGRGRGFLLNALFQQAVENDRNCLRSGQYEFGEEEAAAGQSDKNRQRENDQRESGQRETGQQGIRQQDNTNYELMHFPNRIPPNRAPNAENPFIWPKLAETLCKKCRYKGHRLEDCLYPGCGCYRCYGFGHIARECLQQPRGSERSILCTKCGLYSHQFCFCSNGSQVCYGYGQTRHICAVCTHPDAAAASSLAAESRAAVFSSTAESLASSTADSSAAASGTRGQICVVCLVAPYILAYIPCGHFCVCEECDEMSENLPWVSVKCPMCRTDTFDKIRIYT